MTHAGRSVVVPARPSRSGLLSMVILPLPFIRSIGSADADTGRLRARRHHAAAGDAPEARAPDRLPARDPQADRLGRPWRAGFWHRWAAIVVRRPLVVAVAGFAIVALLLVPASDLNPSDAEAKNLPGKGDAFLGRDAHRRRRDHGRGHQAVQTSSSRATRARRRHVARLEGSSGRRNRRRGGSPGWRKGDSAIVEAFPTDRQLLEGGPKTISHLQHDVLPAAAAAAGGDTRITLVGSHRRNATSSTPSTATSRTPRVRRPADGSPADAGVPVDRAAAEAVIPT